MRVGLRIVVRYSTQRGKKEGNIYSVAAIVINWGRVGTKLVRFKEGEMTNYGNDGKDPDRLCTGKEQLMELQGNNFKRRESNFSLVSWKRGVHECA